MNKKVYYQDLGVVDFKKAWDYQESLLEGIVSIKMENRRKGFKKTTPNYFLFLEHPHVYTLGRSGNQDHLLVNERQLRDREAVFYKTNRGGDITYHGPGQIVGYIILDLENFFTDIHKYLRYLEEVVIRTLSEYKLEGQRSKGETGVWLGVNTPFSRKICAMGIRASRWITMHGFALNINTDLKYFDNIVPCGIKDKSVTSLRKELQKPYVSLGEVKKNIINNFKTLFEVDFIEMN